MIKKMFGLENFGNYIMPKTIFFEAIALLAISAFITSFLPNTFQIKYSTRPRYAVLLAVIFIAALILMNYGQTVFLYYQF